ncbi:MAG: membrane dipeptidase [Steroidobacteraceae bacterium]|jgi:membrane dipeptidase
MAAFNRRTFLSVTAALAATAVLPAHAQRAAGTRPRLIINALGEFDDPNPSVRQSAPTQSSPIADTQPSVFSERVLRDARASGLTAVNVTLGYVAGDDDPFEYTVRDIAQMDATIRRQSEDVCKILSAAEILRAQAEGRIGLIYGFQNAVMLGNDAARVEIFANLGVRVIQLTYNPANALGDGSAEPLNRGLTPFGHEVVGQLNAHGLMVDLSHSGEQTCLEATRASARPVSINHTGCRALNDLPRNKTDEELRLVASRGGFIGIYFMPFLDPSGHATAEEVVAHIDHAVSVCGEDHVGIGTDGSTTPIDDLEAYKAALAREVAARRAAGIGAAGEGPDTFPFTVDLRGPNQFRELAKRLQDRGYSSARIDKILGQNFLRFAKDVWGS